MIRSRCLISLPADARGAPQCAPTLPPGMPSPGRARPARHTGAAWLTPRAAEGRFPPLLSPQPDSVKEFCCGGGSGPNNVTIHSLDATHACHYIAVQDQLVEMFDLSVVIAALPSNICSERSCLRCSGACRTSLSSRDVRQSRGGSHFPSR